MSIIELVRESDSIQIDTAGNPLPSQNCSTDSAQHHQQLCLCIIICCIHTQQNHHMQQQQEPAPHSAACAPTQYKAAVADQLL